MKMDKKRLTIYDISEIAGVSTATVSRVMNGSDRVSSKTRAKVLEAIETSGYEPNAFARGLGSGSMKTIGILCADVKDTYLADEVGYLEQNLKRHGFITILNCTGHEYEEKKECMRQMLAYKVDAVILVGSQYLEPTAKKNRYIIEASQEIPVMMLNGHIRADNVYGVLVDDQQSFYEGTKKLIEDGRKQILFLYREQTASESKKFEGYKQALQEAGIPFDEKLVLGINKRINGVRRGVEAAWKEGLRFDGVMACEDEQAAAALKFLLQEGVHIPEDVAIIGCNNSVLSICTEPDLTTIDNKSVVMCENLVSTLMMVLNGMSPSHKQTIEADLIVRRTTR